MTGGSAAAVGKRIKELRASAGLDQAELGAAVGATRSYVSCIESGKDLPGRALLVALATYFEVSLDWLITGQGEAEAALALTESERQLVRTFRKLPPEEAAAHLALLEARLKNAGP